MFYLQILQSAFQAHYGSLSTMGNNMFLHGTSGRPITSHPATQTTEKGQHLTDTDNISVLSFPFSPITPGGGSVTHNITRDLHVQGISPDANRHTKWQAAEFTANPLKKYENLNEGS